MIAPLGATLFCEQLARTGPDKVGAGSLCCFLDALIQRVDLIVECACRQALRSGLGTLVRRSGVSCGLRDAVERINRVGRGGTAQCLAGAVARRIVRVADAVAG